MICFVVLVEVRIVFEERNKDCRRIRVRYAYQDCDSVIESDVSRKAAVGSDSVRGLG